MLTTKLDECAVVVSIGLHMKYWVFYESKSETLQCGALQYELLTGLSSLSFINNEIF